MRECGLPPICELRRKEEGLFFKMDHMHLRWNWGTASSVLIVVTVLVAQLNTASAVSAAAVDPKIAKLQELVKDLKYDSWIKEDWVLKGYLEAKRGNLEAARQAVEDTVKWRLENRIDGVEKENIDLQLVPPFHLSVAKDGSPVLMWGPARWDIRRIILSGNREKLNRYIDKMYETVYTRVRKAHSQNENITQALQILDLTNYNVRQHACVSCFTLYLEWLSRYENYLPGRQSLWAMINTPQIFKPLLNLLKNIMSPPTRKVLHVYEADKAKFAPVFLELIETDKLPKAWGGTKDDFLN